MKIYLFCIFIILTGCASNGNTTADIQKIVGYPLSMPAAMVPRILDRDTIMVIDTVSAKLLVYYNFEGCSSCKLRELTTWERYIAELDSIAPELEPVFILNVGKAENKTNIDLVTYRFSYPVFYDRTGEFEASNLLPEDPLLHTFLLDKDNKVVLVGSPIDRPKMWELYKSTIRKLVANKSEAVPAN